MARELAKRTAEPVRERAIRPDVDIIETDTEYHLYADLPGVSEDNLDVTLEKEVLTIKGKAEEEIPAGYNQRWAEYVTGWYERRLRITEEVDREGIKATLKNGVLKVVLPKAEAAKAKKIQIAHE